MNLEQLAKKAGVELVECDPSWGGRIGYTTKDNRDVQMCGFHTPNAAYKRWLIDTFGEHTAEALIELLT